MSYQLPGICSQQTGGTSPYNNDNLVFNNPKFKKNKKKQYNNPNNIKPQMQIKPKPPLLLLLTILILTLLYPTYQQLTISNKTISALSTYTIQLNDLIRTIDAGSIIQFQLPFEYYSADDLYVNRPYIGGTDPGDYCPIDCTGVGLQFAGFVFNITGLWGVDAALDFRFTINNVPNPRAAVTVSFIISVIDILGTAQVLQNPSVTFVPKTMTCSATAIQDMTVGFLSTGYFTINPITNPRDYPMSIISVSFPTSPTRWQYEPLRTGTFTSDAYCLSTSQPNIVCSVNSQTILLTGVTYASSIDFQIHSIINPSSAMSAGLITVSTMYLTTTGNRIRLDSCTIGITGFTPTYLLNPSFEISYDSNTMISIDLAAQFPTKVAAGTKVYFTFPPQLPLTGSTCTTPLGVTPIYIPATNTIMIDPFTGLSPKPIPQINCTSITRPRTAFLLSNVSITSTYNGSSVASISCCSTLLKGRNNLNVVSIVTDKPYLQMVNAMYTIQVVNSVVLASGDLVYVYFPKQYAIPIGSITCGATTLSGMISATPTCTVAVGNLVKISGLVIGAVPISTQITFTISGITNPTSNPSSTPFQITLLNSLKQIIESSSSNYVSISAAIINIFTVTTPNTQVLASPIQYTVQFTTNGLLLLNYAVIVTLPVQIGIDLSSLGCVVGSTVSPCWYDRMGNTVHVRVVGNLVSNSVSLKISGGINPESLATTQSFSLQILDPSDNIIQQTNSTLSVTLTMTSTKTFKNLFIALLPTSSPSAVPNIFETLNTLQIIAITVTKIKVTHKLMLSYNPQQILFNYGSLTSSCSTGFICVFDTVTGLINITGLDVGSDTITLNITQAIGLLMRPTIKLTLLTTTNYKILQSNQTVSQYIPDIITYNLTQTTYQYAATTDISISYSFTALTATGLSVIVSRLAYILVYVPSQYSTSYTSNVYNTSVINGVISMTNLTNPTHTDVVSGYFYIQGFGAGAQLLAISVGNVYYQHVCTLPCRTCTTNLTNCLTCYTWHPRNLLFTNTTTNTSTCRSSCPQFYYQNTTSSSCQPCDSNCYECSSTISTKCLSCDSGNYLHQVDYVCYADCPAGYYQFGNGTGGICRSCTSNCLTCLNQTYCNTCATGMYIYGNLCLSGCPPFTYSTTLPVQTCIDCGLTKPNCIDCDQSTCYACTPTYFLSSNQCSTSCPFPLYPTISGLCKDCQCATCSNYANNCTACKITKPYMYNNYCYSSCPSGLYPNTLKMCISCPTNCITCSNSSVCILCKQGFVIMSYNSISNVSCIANTSCPNTTILTVSSTGIPSCLPCTSHCATCSLSVSFCLTCTTNYNLFNNECLFTCPSPYHPIQSICQKCISTCQTCNPLDPYNCTQCKPNYYLYNDTCYSTCLSGTYMDLISKRCVTCLSVCNTCSNATNCTTCATGYFLFNWLCYNTCPTIPVVYYQYNGVCSACQPQCTTCLGSPIACSSCSDPSYLYNLVTKQCTFQCLSPYFQNESTCIACQSPCLTCDTTFNSCNSCAVGLYVFNGTCVSTCPSGYYKNTTVSRCMRCTFPCKICLQNQCLLCQSFAYMYQKSCVLVCPADMPYQQPGYCSDCLGIGFCARCTKQSGTNQDICSQCVYPYVLFEGNCLNSCPVNYTASDTGNARICEKSAEYLLYLQMKEAYNRPILPPFLMFGLYLLVGGIIGVVSHRKYRFTYHVGFMLSFLVFVHSIFTYYSLYFIDTRYEGQYVPVVPKLPSYLIAASIVFNNIILTIVFWITVLKNIYLKDIRYSEWKQKYNIYWWISTICLLPFGGHRLHKINYSKIFGLDRFSYRIVSVQKFYQEDVITYCSAIGDLFQILAVVICVYNVFMNYNGVFFIGYETVLFKVVLWLLILYDLKKPDRGFFIGDEEQAEEQIRKQEEQQAKKLNRMDTENFAKLIRTKSAYVLKNQKYFGNIDVDDFISVYNPDDYEEVIKVPNKKIEKNIYKGKYRKGRKITIEEKLNKYVDTIKPKPQIDKKKVNSYIHMLIYWKPPQMKKTSPIKQLPPSEHSLLALLERKQQEYKEDLDNIELVDEEKQRKYYTRPRYDQRTFLDDVDETIPNQTVEMFYPNFESSQKKNSLDFDDLLNLNYARRKHLDKNEQQKQELESKSKRQLHHEPQKKRRNLKGFGQMVLKNQYQY